jgi:hypothetical protein
MGNVNVFIYRMATNILTLELKCKCHTQISHPVYHNNPEKVITTYRRTKVTLATVDNISFDVTSSRDWCDN